MYCNSSARADATQEYTRICVESWTSEPLENHHAVIFMTVESVLCGYYTELWRKLLRRKAFQNRLPGFFEHFSFTTIHEEQR